MSLERNILLKNWEKLENDAIIKDAATKGKYINLCITFLAKRNSLSAAEAKEFFNVKVYSYITNLLKNRQIYKAEHVLRNIDESPKYAFYEIIKSLPEPDADLTDYVYTYLNKKYDTFQADLLEIHPFLLLLEYIKLNKPNLNYDSNFINLNLNNLITYQNDDFIKWRQMIVIDILFQFKNESIDPLIGRDALWQYLVTNRKLFLLNKWTEICADRQNYVRFIQQTNFSDFAKFLFKKFSQFEITNDMFRKITDDGSYSRVLVNNFSKINLYFTHEFNDNFKLLARLYESQNLNHNLIDYEWWLNLLVDKNLDIIILKLLNNNTKLLSDYRSDNDKILGMRELISNKNDLYKLSQKLENYHSENQTIKMIIKFLNNNSIEFDSFKHYDNFVKSTNRNPDEDHNELLLNSLIEKYFAINMIKIKNSFNDKELSELPNFSNTILMASNHGNLIKLSYLYYIKQFRASHAVYLYFIDQLRNYSKITKEQKNFTIIAVNDMILNNINNPLLLTHLIAFAEMLGYQTINLRSQIKLIQFAQQYGCTDDNANANNNRVEMTPQEFLNFFSMALNNYLIRNQYNCETIYPILYAAVNFCNTNKLAYPDDYLIDLLSIHNKWKLVLILCDKLNYPLWQIVRILDSVPSTLSTNIIKAISRSRRGLRSNNTDLLLVIIEAMVCGASLYEQAIKLRSPILIVLSAMEMNEISDELLRDMWRYWLMFSINYESIDFEDVNDINLIVHCVRRRLLQTLHISVEVFYPESDFIHLTKYLLKTSKFKFCDTVNNIIQQYIYHRHNNTNNNPNVESNNFLNNISTSNINCILIEHLIHNFDSFYHKKLLLHSYCDTNVSLMIDYCLLLKIIHVIEQCDSMDNSYNLLTALNIRNLLNYDEQEDAVGYDNNEYEILLINLIKMNEYGCALSLYQLLGETDNNKNKNNFIKSISHDYIIIKYWQYKLDRDRNGPHKISVQQFIDSLLDDVLVYQLNRNLIIEFLLNNLYKFKQNLNEKYLLLKNILEIIKLYNLYPNDVCDRDRIEYEMIQNYLEIKRKDSTVPLDLYYSKHYEEHIKIKNIICSTYAELKEYAELDVLTICNTNLMDLNETAIIEDLILTYLDDGDIIQALRLQMMFSVKPQDLRFVVFCMSLGETIELMYDLNQSERQLLYESSTRVTQVNRNFIKLRSQSSSLSSSPNFTATEFEEFPPREKQDILDVMQGLANNLQHGKKIAERVIMIYRAAMYLDKEYTDLIKIDNVYSFLESIVNEDFFNKLIIINDIMISMKLSSNEIAEFIADQMTCSIIRSRFYTMTDMEKYGKNVLWGFNLDRDFHLFLDLCPSTTQLGNLLLQYCDCLKIYRRMADPANNSTEHLDEEILKIIQKLQKIMEFQVLSHEKQNIIYVELLTKAHECYVHECYMEGIANILQRSKILNTILTNSKSWNLIVRLLIGIGRYREMYYCFETLIKNEHFESLLVRQHDDNYPLCTLKPAIISYLRENYKENTAVYIEYYKLAAVHFCMYKELGQMYESESSILLGHLLSDCEIIRDYEWNREILKLPYIKYSEFIPHKLNLIMEKNIHAAENYLQDNKLNLAQRSALNGELIALQLSLFKIKLVNCENPNDLMVISVLNIRNYGIFRYFINNILNFHQTLIMNRTYSSFEINWADVIYNQYILNNNRDYLSDFLVKIDLNENLLENIVKLYQMEMKISQTMENSMRMLIEKIDTVALKYKLASLLGFKTIVSELLNNQSVYYLKDTDYGRNNVV